MAVSPSLLRHLLVQKRLPLFLLLGLILSLTSCEQLIKKLTTKNIEGFYKSKDGKMAEFTASKVIITDKEIKDMAMTFDYKVEGKHVFLETKSNVGGLGSLLMAIGNMQFEIIDDNTLKFVSSGLGTKIITFKRVNP